MEEILELLKRNIEKYTEMRPQDCIKLIYQRHYGPGHMIPDPDASLSVLKAELDTLVIAGKDDLAEPLGNHLCRLNLKEARSLYTPEEINEIFVRTAAIHRPVMADFMHELKLVKENIMEFPVVFSREDFDAYFAWYRGKGYPAVHHSPFYHAFYDPHYRVIYEGMLER